MAEKPNKEIGGPRNLSTTAKVIVVVFAVIMALSMMLPSLASMFAGKSSSSSDDTQDQEQVESQDDAKDDGQDDEEGEFDPTKGVPENEKLQELATTNAQKAHDLEGRLKKDPENIAVLLNLGETYMSWGYSAMNDSTTDEEKDYSKGLLDKASDAFTQYLQIRDSDAVRVNLAQCKYYKGETKEAIAALKEITEKSPDYPLAWAYLGMFYEQEYDYENATAAFKKAVECDPDDEYGVSSYANQQLISMNSKVDSPSDAGDATVESNTSDDQESLSSTLGGL